MEEKIKVMSKVMEDVTEKTNTCVKELKKTEEEVIKRIANMIKEADSQRKDTTERVENELSAVRSNVEHLQNIKISVSDGADHKTMKNCHEMVRRIIKNDNLTGRKYYQYPQLKLGNPRIEESLGRINRKEISVMLNDIKNPRNERTELPRQVTSASQLTCTGRNAFF